MCTYLMYTGVLISYAGIDFTNNAYIVLHITCMVRDPLDVTATRFAAIVWLCIRLS